MSADAGVYGCFDDESSGVVFVDSGDDLSECSAISADIDSNSSSVLRHVDRFNRSGVVGVKDGESSSSD